MEINILIKKIKEIADYMTGKEFYNGEEYGILVGGRNIQNELRDLIKECEGNRDNSKPANCAIFDVNQRSELLKAFLDFQQNKYTKPYDTSISEQIADFEAFNCG